MANRRQPLFAPLIIWRIHASIYAPTARSADTCVCLAVLVSAPLVLLMISDRCNSASAQG